MRCTTQANVLWGVKNAELWLELSESILRWLQVAMVKAPAEEVRKQDSPKPEKDGPDSSPPKKKRRRFQAKKSPVKRKKKGPKKNEETDEQEIAEPQIEENELDEGTEDDQAAEDCETFESQDGS